MYTNILLLLVGANLFVTWCISGSVCFTAVLDSPFKLWMDSVYCCRMDDIDVAILIFVSINCIHFMSCDARMMSMSSGVV